MMTFSRNLKIAVGFVCLLGMPAVAEAANECEPFTITGGADRHIEYVDVGPEGPSHGDVRMGRRSALDGEGQKVGEIYWTITSLPTPPGGTERVAQQAVMILADGEIHWQHYAARRNPASDKNSVSVSDYTGVILGGTGAYAFARGTIDVAFDGTDNTYTLNIRCE